MERFQLAVAKLVRVKAPLRAEGVLVESPLLVAGVEGPSPGNAVGLNDGVAPSPKLALIPVAEPRDSLTWDVSAFLQWLNHNVFYLIR